MCRIVLFILFWVSNFFLVKNLICYTLNKCIYSTSRSSSKLLGEIIKRQLTRYFRCDIAHYSFNWQIHLRFLIIILHLSHDSDHFTHTNTINTAITTGIMSRSVVQYKRSALPVFLMFHRMLQSAVVTILLLLFATSNGFYRWVLFAISVLHILSFCTSRKYHENSCFLRLSPLHLVYLKEVNSHHFNCHY